MSTIKRKRCWFCKKLTEKWQRVNRGIWHCYDGCYSTTGYDHRTTDGKPWFDQITQKHRDEKLTSEWKKCMGMI